jgi:hypothetical protein
MDLGGVEKKIREAEFFLERMREFEKRMLPSREPFDFYLSALLGAGRAVEPLLRGQEEAAYTAWRRAWTSANGPADELLVFFADDRSVEIHESGSRQAEGKGPLALAKTQHQEGGATVTVTGPPGVFPLAALQRDHFFLIDGAPHKVTDACAEYVKVLKKLVAAFKADHA